MIGRPATAVGCDAEGERPWRAEVQWAAVVLDAPGWGSHPASALRGAIVAALGGPEAHVDLHGHGPEGTRQARAVVCYRADPLRVWCHGPRALEHAQAIGSLDHLLLPSGDGVRVEGATVSHGRLEIGLHKERWFRYELASAYFPPTATYERRPRGKASPEQRAWAGQALASSIRLWQADYGLDVVPHRPVHVQIEGYQVEQCLWRNRSEAVRYGFVARFVSNAILPDGVGLGQHVSEGWGEVRRA